MNLNVLSTKLVSIPPNPNGELSDHVLRVCNFCNKNIELFGKEINEKLSGENDFYCTFCLRHGFGTRNNRNILPLSLCSIIGYFYYESYCQGRKMWLSEIHDYIECHRETGLVNPVFSYDEDSYMWFVDFSKVGISKKRIPVEEVLKTLINIIACFNLQETIPALNHNAFYKKYEGAILNFHSKRFRPENKKHLIPSFSGCMNRGFGSFEKIKFFQPKLLTENK